MSNLISVLIFFIGLIVGAIVSYVLFKKNDQSDFELDRLKNELKDSDSKFELLKVDFDETNKEKIKAITSLTHLTDERNELKIKNEQMSRELLTFESDKASFHAEKIALKERIQEQKEETKKIQEKFKIEIKSIQNSLGNNFEILANRIFDDKTSKFRDESKRSLEGILYPLKENIENFKREFSNKYIRDNESRIRLEEEIKNLTGLSNTLSKEANNLSSALSGSVKAQGNWGEIVLERVLKYSGLKEGEDFIREGKGLGLKDDTNRHQKPDVIINLPDEKHLIIDSKVTLNSYTRYIASINEEEREKSLMEFIIAFKNRINELSGKNYELLEKLITPEYVMMFTPIEGALSLALEKEPTLFEYGWEKRIILVGPTNLLATLKAVESVWKQDKQEKNAIKIAEQGGRLYDKFKGFIDDMQDINKHINKTSDAYEKAFKKLSSGSGNLIGQAERMKKLGAKAKKTINKDLLETNSDIEELDYN